MKRASEPPNFYGKEAGREKSYTVAKCAMSNGKGRTTQRAEPRPREWSQESRRTGYGPTLCGLSVCVPLISTTPFVLCWGWDLWEVIGFVSGHGGRAPCWDPLWAHEEIRTLSLYPVVYNEWEGSRLKIRKRILPRRGICQRSLGLPVFWSVRNKCVLSKFPSLWYSVIAALTAVQSEGAEEALIRECSILLE